MNKRLRSIGVKITMLVLSATLVSTAMFGVIAYVGMHSVRDMTRDSNATLGQIAAEKSSGALTVQAQNHLLELVKGAAELDNERLSSIQGQVEMLAAIAENTYREPAQYPAREIMPPLAENTGRLAAQLLFAEDYAETADTLEEIGRLANLQDILTQFAAGTPSVGGVYISTESGFTLIADTMSGSRLDPGYRHPIQERPWYRLAMERDRLAWTDAMMDGSGRGLGIVCAAPVHSLDGQTVAVVGIGSLLTDLQQRIGTQIGDSGYLFLMNEQGGILLSGSGEEEFSPETAGGGASLLQSARPELAEAAKRMTAGERGSVELSVGGRPVYLAYHPIETLGWSLGAVMEKAEVVAPAEEMALVIGEASGGIMGEIDAEILKVLGLVMLLLVAVGIAVAFCGISLSRRLTMPLGQLMQGVREVGGGNLAQPIRIKTGDELEQLADAFNNMTEELRLYISNLTRVTADKERISTELNVATRIQTSMLPCIFPAFPQRPEFDIYATMNPAKEVGGDFYDFFLIGEKKMGIVVADVSGKGVPAALFMVIAKTLIKNHAQSGLGPAEVFALVNNQLCENNEENMFVTAFLGVLDMESGLFAYVNAGHNPPLIARSGEPYRWLRERSGLILAGMGDAPYRQFETRLQAGDRLFLYTDGVTEAQNAEGELYGEQRLLDLFRSGKAESETSRACLDILSEELAAFAGGAEQADDITMLYLRIR